MGAPTPERAMRGTAPLAAAFEEALVALRRETRVVGAMLVSRDGLPVLNECPGVAQPEAFGAMHAAALGAAEVALRGAAAGCVSLVAQVGAQRFVSRGLTDDLFVVAMVGDDCACATVFAWMDRLAERLQNS